MIGVERSVRMDWTDLINQFQWHQTVVELFRVMMHRYMYIITTTLYMLLMML